MASTRAEDVAEILWELKRADKLATYSTIAKRAGFSAGSQGKAMNTALRTVRRDWPHLQWWRAIMDNAVVEKGSEHEEKLAESGYDIQPVDGKEDAVTLAELETQLMSWEEEPQEDGAE